MVEAQWQGRRVSVRRVVERTPEGRLVQADVVGDLVGLDTQTAVVRARDGLVEVPLALVTAARLVPPSTREELDLQQVASHALRPAQTEPLDGWLLRADPGAPRRANSVLPRAQLHLSLDDALAQTHAWYAARDKPVVVQIPYPARRLLDAALDERGWHYEAPSTMLSTALSLVPQADPDGVRLEPEPDDDWLQVNGGDRDLLLRHDAVVFASVRGATGDVLGVARGTVDDGWLGVTSLAVVPDARRRGTGRALVTALAGWATARGADLTFTQVEQGNGSAQALFAGLGYTLHHAYHYRREP